MSDWVDGRVHEVIRWSDKLFSLRIEADLAPYQAGQFTKLSLMLPSADGSGAMERVSHAYSFVNGPAAPYHEFYIVLIPEGRLTPHLARLQPGDTLQLAKAASGFLTLNEIPPARDLWMLSTGTAIGPFLSILAAGEAQRRFRHLVLVHGVRLGEELTYRATIDELVASLGGRLHYVPFISRESWPQGLSGRIPAAIADGRLEQAVDLSLSPELSQVMICGNPQMVKDTQEILQARGLRKNLRRAPGEITVEHYW